MVPRNIVVLVVVEPFRAKTTVRWCITCIPTRYSSINSSNCFAVSSGLGTVLLRYNNSDIILTVVRVHHQQVVRQ